MQGSHDVLVTMSQYRSDSRQVIVDTLRQAGDEVRNRPGTIAGGVGDGSIQAAFLHTVDVEESWLHEFLLDEGFSDGPDPERYRDFESIAAIWEQVSEEWDAYLRARDDAALWEPFAFANGTSVPTWMVAWHVFNHTTHHTAEMWTALTAAGFSPPEVEVMAWARNSGVERPVGH